MWKGDKRPRETYIEWVTQWIPSGRYIHLPRWPRFSWNNGQQGMARRLARLDRFYTPKHSRLGIRCLAYFIHGYTVGSDHAPVQLELAIGEEGTRNSAYKWNLTYLDGEMSDALGLRWTSLPENTSFFHKLRDIKRFYMQHSKTKAREFRKVELDTKPNLELATATLHEDMYDVDKQGEVNRLKRDLDEIETRKARGEAIQSRVKWQQVGNRCTADFFKSVRQKNAQAIIPEVKDNQEKIFTTRKDMEQICVDFYQ